MRTITRKQVFEQYVVIASLIADFQRQFFDPEYNDANNPMYDALHYPNTGEELYYDNFITLLPHDDIHLYPDDLATCLRQLLSDLGCEELLILSFMKMDLFGNTAHQDKELVQAHQFLAQHTGTNSYDEAFVFSLDRLEEWIDSFFWLSRLDPSLPEFVFFVDTKQRFCFYICNRGNLHWLLLSADIPLSDTLFREHGFVVGPDVDQFS